MKGKPAGRPDRPHPDAIVELFLSAEPDFENLLHVLTKSGRPLSPKAEAIRLLLEMLLRGEPADQHLERIESAYHERSNVDLHILFLMAWLYALLFRDYNWPRIELLRDRIHALISEKTPPEIVAWATLIDGIVRFHSGNVVAYLETMKELGAGVPASSLHYKRLMLLRAAGYFQLGTAPVAKTPPNRREMTEFEWRRVQALRGSNCALRGEIPEDIDSILAMPPVTSHTRGPLAHGGHEVAYETLKLIVAWRRGGAILVAQGEGRDDEAPWVISTRHLMAGRSDEALEWARIHQQQLHAVRRTLIGFDEYALIRAELASGHSDVAKRLLLARKKQGTCHYIDSLYYARAELLDGRRDLAAQHFARMLRDAETYQAKGRLDLELALASELTPTQLVDLSRQAEQAREVGNEGETVASSAHPRSAPRQRGVDRLISSSAALAAVRDRVLTFAQRDAPVLVTGETGTGKELIAQALHESGAHARAPFVAINCGALSDTLVESELFGHERGAFTGAQAAHAGLFRDARKGTLFLDEIGDISSRLQVALLRVLETGEARPVGSSKRYKTACRIIAATNADLEQRVEEGRFRRDLFFRLQRLRIHLPPLRDRPDDILTLAQSFFHLDRAAGQQVTLSSALVTALQRYAWPGNVRELRNAIEQMRVLSSDKLSYEVEDLDAVLAPLQRTSRSSAVASAVAAPDPAANPDLSDQRPAPPASAPLRREAPPGTTMPSEEEIERYLAGGRSTLRRLARLEALFQRFEALKTHEVARILGVSRHTARKDLKQLCERGVIEKVTPSAARGTHYYTIRSHPQP